MASVGSIKGTQCIIRWVVHCHHSVCVSVYLPCKGFVVENGKLLLHLEHSNSRFESIRYANRFESIHLVKNRPFDSLVVMQFFLVYILYSLRQKIS